MSSTAISLHNVFSPLQSCGTLLRAFFAMRKQHTKQVTPVESITPDPLV
jgi:hypothetical protein